MSEPKDFDFGLWRILNTTRQLIFKGRKKELLRQGTTTRKAASLDVITRLGGTVRQSEVARQIFTERHIVSEQLTNMEKEGLIKRFRDLERKNEVRVELTERGKELYPKVQVRKSIHDAMSVLTEEEKLVLWRILAKLRDSNLSNLNLSIDKSNISPPSDPEKY